MTNIAQRLDLIRAKMRENKIEIYIIPTIDMHNSEYVPECYQRRAWISGFDGSNGEAIITLDHAYLWTDGRYLLQAELQLDKAYFTLQKDVTVEDWLLSESATKQHIGVDPRLVSVNRVKLLHEKLKHTDAELVFIEDNLVDLCRLECGEHIEFKNNNSVFIHPEKYAGQNLDMRLAMIRQSLLDSSADFLLLNVLDEIAWVFNIRGSDIAYNPLVISYAILGASGTSWLFIDNAKVRENVANYLKAADVVLLPYDAFASHLNQLRGTIWLDDKTANYYMKQHTSNAQHIYSTSPIVLAKACKNTVEIGGTQQAHMKDAVAVINFLSWLDVNWQNGVSELSCVEQLHKFRTEQANFVTESFSTISGFAKHGAIIHYRVEPETDITVDNSNIYLLDSGGQYLEGTTDITRTVHLGQPTDIQKHHYTLVLKGHLALGRAVFPHGTCGEHLDALARIALWQEKLNYRHGTGHGVGSFLCVHEGPQRIAAMNSNVPLLPGMIVSNEPGLYMSGAYGIRIENLCFVSEACAENESEYGAFYRLSTLTLVPYCKKLIAINELTAIEKEQIAAYYAEIKKLVRPRLSQAAQAWLDNELDIFILEGK